jgi:hypothetical protein
MSNTVSFPSCFIWILRMVLNKKTLMEKNFIQNQPILSSLPFWTWIGLFALIILIVIGSLGWFSQVKQEERKGEPFLKVTNRQMSVFLWNFPAYMRVNAPKKSGYLTGFQADKENLDVSLADELVAAPPELLFLYHTWNRLLSPEFIKRAIDSSSFSEFLEQFPEWQPANWKEAPSSYVDLISLKKYENVADLEELSIEELPLIVRQAFVGAKNYFKEGPEINALKPSFLEVDDFIQTHPAYARNFWRNLHNVVNSQYLISLTDQSVSPSDSFPSEQLAPFLKIALYNNKKQK